MTRWKCSKCRYVYDPRVGDPEGGIAPGTPFEKIPTSWRCPICGATKKDFYVLPQPISSLPPKPASAIALPGTGIPRPTPKEGAPTLFSALPQTPVQVQASGGRAPMWTVGPLK